MLNILHIPPCYYEKQPQAFQQLTNEFKKQAGAQNDNFTLKALSLTVEVKKITSANPGSIFTTNLKHQWECVLIGSTHLDENGGKKNNEDIPLFNTNSENIIQSAQTLLKTLNDNIKNDDNPNGKIKEAIASLIAEHFLESVYRGLVNDTAGNVVSPENVEARIASAYTPAARLSIAS